MLTLFTAPKPFHGPIDIIQRNAIQSWLKLGPEVEVLLIGDEEGMAKAAADFGVRHLKDIRRNKHGTPYVDSVFALARKEARYPVLCFVNADMIFLDDFLPAINRVKDHFEGFLVFGQRWDLDVTERLEFGAHWLQGIRERLRAESQLHGPLGSDYFVFARDMFSEMPSFALGRPGWDNWLIYAGRSAHVPVVDATKAITIIHQNHDYSHLPGGRPPYGGPESRENLAAAGGMEVIFMPSDADWVLTKTELAPKSWREKDLLRWVESSLIARFGTSRRSHLVRMIFHPTQAIRYYINAVRRRVQRVGSDGQSPD